MAEQSPKSALLFESTESPEIAGVGQHWFGVYDHPDGVLMKGHNESDGSTQTWEAVVARDQLPGLVWALRFAYPGSKSTPIAFHGPEYEQVWGGGIEKRRRSGVEVSRPTSHVVVFARVRGSLQSRLDSTVALELAKALESHLRPVESRAQMAQRHAREMTDLLRAEVNWVETAPTGPADEPDLDDHKPLLPHGTHLHGEVSGAAQFPPATEAARERARSTWQWKEGTVRIRLGADDGAPKHGNFALATRDRDGRLQIEVWRGGSDVDNPTHHLAVQTDRGPLVRGYGAALSDEDVEALRGLLGPSTRERELEALVQAGITSERAVGQPQRSREQDVTIAELRSELAEARRMLDAREPLGEQIDRLATFILDEVPDEPSQPQGAIDTAIRVIRDLRERVVQPVAYAERPTGFQPGAYQLGARLEEPPVDAATRGVDLRSRALAEAQRVLGLTPPPAPDAAGAFSRSAIAEYRSAIETTATYLLTGPDPEERQRKAVEDARKRGYEEGRREGIDIGRKDEQEQQRLQQRLREEALTEAAGPQRWWALLDLDGNGVQFQVLAAAAAGEEDGQAFVTGRARTWLREHHLAETAEVIFMLARSRTVTVAEAAAFTDDEMRLTAEPVDGEKGQG